MTGNDLNESGALLGRLSQFGQRLRQADRERPVVLDATVVLLVFLIFCLPDLVDKGSVGGDAPTAIRVLSVHLLIPNPASGGTDAVGLYCASTS